MNTINPADNDHDGQNCNIDVINTLDISQQILQHLRVQADPVVSGLVNELNDILKHASNSR